MIKLPHSKVVQLQNKFFKTVKGLPVKCTLIKTNLATSGAGTTGFDQLMKTTPKTADTTYTLQCLYKKTFTPFERTKMGLHESVTAVVWVSPLELKAKIGVDTIDKHDYQVQFSDMAGNRIYLINLVVPLDPVYETVIAIMLHLEDHKM
jgi:hypothetical protein